MKSLWCAVVVLSLLAAGCGCENIEAGSVGVQTRFGKVQDQILYEGFNWVSVWNDVHPMTTRTQTYTMAGDGHEGQSDGTVNVLAKDQLAVTMDVSVMFHLNAPHSNKVYRFFGEDYANSIVHPLVRTAIRDAAAEFRAVQLIDERSALQRRMEKIVEGSLRGTLRSRRINTHAIVVDNILVRNIDLPNSLEEAIANVQRQSQQTAQRQQALLTARAEADRLRTEADGTAAATLVRARAEAEANRLVTASLTPEVLRLRQIEAQQAMLSNQHTRLVIVPSGTNTTLMMPGSMVGQ